MSSRSVGASNAVPSVPVRIDARVEVSGFDLIREELGLSAPFPGAVVAEAREASRNPAVSGHRDATDIAFVTLDPAGSRDLDQAFSLRRSKSGYLAHYAIADVSAFVRPGAAVDGEARRRGVTFYFPDIRVPLHPTELSEGAASLLPGEVRPAVLWTFDLDSSGEVRAVSVDRALVRSRGAHSYSEVQAELDSGIADEQFVVLREVGRLREEHERDRGGVSLHTPEQLVVPAEGRYDLVYRSPLPVERWNAQLSLLTGMAAASIMLDGGTGVLRTLPPPDPDVVELLRLSARALGVPWAPEARYSEFIRSLDPGVPDHAALLAEASRLFRGAGYAAFDGERPLNAIHAAVGAPYAHVTAPLRRLVDRFANEIVIDVSADREPAGWARDALAALPDLMADARGREAKADGMVIDLVEATTLADRVGEALDAVVLRRRDGNARVQLRRPAVVADCRVGETLDPQPGDEVLVRIAAADPAARAVALELIEERPPPVGGAQEAC